MKEIRILRTDSISFLEIGSEQIEIKDYIIKSSADGSTELEVKICGVSNIFESSANLEVLTL